MHSHQTLNPYAICPIVPFSYSFVLSYDTLKTPLRQALDEQQSEGDTHQTKRRGVICLGDMPHLSPSSFANAMQSLKTLICKCITVPSDTHSQMHSHHTLNPYQIDMLHRSPSSFVNAMQSLTDQEGTNRTVAEHVCSKM